MPHDALRELRESLRAHASPARAATSSRYFKTGPGEYGEGDVFIGVTVPDCRAVAKRFRSLTLSEVKRLLASEVHEERLVALLVLVEQSRSAKKDLAAREAIFRLYLASLQRINNWDLVDLSAPDLVGGYLVEGGDRALLDGLAASRHLWSRRVAMLACFAFIRRGESADALRLAERLVDDEHDLMHKAVGWMLREVGKRVGLEPLRAFLERHAATMPRTMLRYAIEKLSDAERRRWAAARRASGP